MSALHLAASLGLRHATPPPPPTIISGLDLGQAKDSTAQVTVARHALACPTPKRRWRYVLRWIEVWELGTKYTTIADDLCGLYERPQLANTRLVPDYTGVGRPVVDLLRAKRVRAKITPVLTTSGRLSHEDAEGVWHVPKRDLVSTLQVLLQGAHLTIDARVPHVPRLQRELASFRETITKSKNVTFGAEQSQHDDIVFGLMLACWHGERDAGASAAGVSSASGRDACLASQAPGGVFHEPPREPGRHHEG